MPRFSFSPAVRIILAALLLAAVGAAVYLWQTQPAQAAPRAPAPVPVVTSAVEQRDVPQAVNAVGTVRSVHDVVIRSQVAGVLTEVLFEEGQQVKKGDLLARIDDRSIRAELNQARAGKARNEAELKAAQTELERARRLAEQNAISRQEVEQQAALVAQLTAGVRADEAAIAAAEVQLSHTLITSPVTGRVGLRRVDPGNVVGPGTTDGLVGVTQIEPITVQFALPQTLLPRLGALIQGGAAPVDVYDRAGGTLLARGTLATIDNRVDRASGTIALKARFDNADGLLWPGQSVAVRLQTGASPGALVVPVTAVRHGLEGRYVFRVIDGQAEVAPVKVAFEDHEIAVIAEGIAAGEQVVVDGHSRLKAGARVNVLEPSER